MNEKVIQRSLKNCMRLFSQRPDGHYEFRVAEGVSVDRSVFEKWSNKKEIIYALRAQIVRAKRRSDASYDSLLNMLGAKNE